MARSRRCDARGRHVTWGVYGLKTGMIAFIPAGRSWRNLTGSVWCQSRAKSYCKVSWWTRRRRGVCSSSLVTVFASSLLQGINKRSIVSAWPDGMDNNRDGTCRSFLCEAIGQRGVQSPFLGKSRPYGKDQSSLVSRCTSSNTIISVALSVSASTVSSSFSISYAK